MKYCVYAIFDSAIKTFSAPQTTSHRGAALRGFGDAVNNKETVFAGHPDDYDLYILGEFDDQTGLFSTGAPEALVRGKDLVRS